MDDKHSEQQPRASLRGKGREILLGQQSLPLDDDDTPRDTPPPPRSSGLDASALSLTPEETEALLDFSGDSPAYDASVPLPARSAVQPPEQVSPPNPTVNEDNPVPDWWLEDTNESGQATFPDWWTETEDTSPVAIPEPAAVDSPEPEDSFSEFDTFDDPNLLLEEEAELSPPEGPDSLPLAERASGAEILDWPYKPHPDVEVLIPAAPERWVAAPDDALLTEAPSPEPLPDSSQVDHEGGLVTPESAAVEVNPPVGVPDPFVPTPQRLTAEVLFEETRRADPALLALLVDDDRIRKLALQIDALQEDLANNAHSYRGSADVYQQELLRASGLLLATRQNYDDARAIVYRVRADMNRERKIHSDIMRYRPLLLMYFTGWGIALVFALFPLKNLFAGIAEAVGLGVFSALYFPMLFGIVGALISGYLTLERHTTKLHDFDPIHVSWYLYNPLLGGVMGLLMFLLASIANEDLLRETASEAERAITYLLCVVAGMNQNSVLRQLNNLLERFGRSGSDHQDL